MSSYPALSLHQPWAALVAFGAKPTETRHWRAPKGLVGRRWLIHAAKKPIPSDLDEDLAALCERTFGPRWRKILPLGAFVCSAVLSECFLMEETDDPLQGAASLDDLIAGYWAPGRFGWRWEEVSLFTNSIPALGRQSIWTATITEPTP